MTQVPQSPESSAQESTSIRRIGLVEDHESVALGLAAMLAGEIGRAEALERAQAATRQYAKRQYTWLRHQPPADWPRTDATDIINRMANFARIV